MRQPAPRVHDRQGRTQGERHIGAWLSATIVVAAWLTLGALAAHAQSLVAPTTLTATTLSKTEISLAWNDPNSPTKLQEAGYIVQQQAAGASGWTKVFMSGPDVTTWTSTGLAVGATYSYRIKAYLIQNDQVFYSLYSPVATATTLSSQYPDPPTNLAATVSGTQVNLTWRDNANNESGYQVSRAHPSVGDWAVIGTTGANQTSFTDTGAAAGTTWVYKVRAYNATGKSSPSNVVTVSVPASTSGQTLWSQRYGGSGVDVGEAVTVDRSGNIIIAGGAKDSVDFGGGAVSGTGTSAFIAKYSSSRAYLWARRFNNGTSDTSSYAYGVGTDGSGNVYITGTFMGSVDFGGGALVSAGWSTIKSQDAFIASYSSTGAYRWAKNFGSGTDAFGYAVAGTSSGDVIVTGQVAGRVNLGCGIVATTSSSHDVFVARYTGATGACQWAKVMGGTAEDAGMGVAVAPNGDVVVTGFFQNTANFGGGSITSVGLSDIFIARYSGTGAYLWARTVGNTGDDRANAVAVDASGNIVIAGHFAGAVNFGGGAISSNGSWDGFVAKYSSTGAYIWARDLGGSATDEAFGVATDASGNVMVVGGFQGTVNFGGGPLNSAGFWDAFAAKLSSASGDHIWSRAFGSSNDDLANAVIVDGAGNALVTGYFQNTVNFGGPSGTLTSVGTNVADIFLIAIGP